MKYLNIVLSNLSVFPCCGKSEISETITKDILCAGFKYAEDNKLGINVFYPKGDISDDIKTLLSKTPHNRIIPSTVKCQKGDIVVIGNWMDLELIEYLSDVRYIVVTTRKDLGMNWQYLPFDQNVRIDIAVLDLEGMKSDDFDKYHTILANMAESMADAYAKGVHMQCNLLTDRISFNTMHSCGAGEDHITLAPNGKVYVCPAFYFTQMKEISNDLKNLDIKNQQLYTIDYAPICKHCDAYHCKRCIWLNKKLTLEVNTPSKEQCVVAHIERNAARQLSLQAEDKGRTRTCEIPDLPYLDPFEERLNWLK